MLHRVSVVIPALNEAANLPYVLPLIPRSVHEVVMVDGSSTDGTTDVAREFWPGIVVVNQKRVGKGSALRTGFSAATGEIIVMLDADGSTDPREIPTFVKALCAGADFVKGSRFMPGGGTYDMPVYRKLGNRAFVGAVRVLFGGGFTDLCYGYCAFWARVLPQLRLDATGFEIETQMALRALWAGLRVVEVPSFEAARVSGSGNLRTIPDGWRVLKEIWRERFRSPIARDSAAWTSRQTVGIPVTPRPSAPDEYSKLSRRIDVALTSTSATRSSSGRSVDSPEPIEGVRAARMAGSDIPVAMESGSRSETDGSAVTAAATPHAMSGRFRMRRRARSDSSDHRSVAVAVPIRFRSGAASSARRSVVSGPVIASPSQPRAPRDDRAAP
jgi:hypothetical protein